MKFLSHCVSHCALCTLLILTLSYNFIVAQTDDPFQSNNFDEDMGIWSISQSASIVPVNPNSNQQWLLLQKGDETDGVSGAQDPFLATEALQLNGNCGVTISFELFALHSSLGEMVYIEASSDNGRTYKILRESQEEMFLESGKSFVNGSKSRFSFPLRSFVSDQIVLRLRTKNMSQGSQFFLDNINLISSEKEDYLLAEWQMGQAEGQASSLLPDFDPGNCSGVIAHPIGISVEGSHVGVEGFTYDFLEDSPNVQSSRLGDGGLCIDVQNSLDQTSNSITFALDLVPAEKGIISGFEFMEKAPTYLNGVSNNYPTAFSIEIYKEGELIFSQANIPTSNEWSDRTFRLDHIRELITSTRAQYTFVLTPESNNRYSDELAVWLIDEVKVLGGCCDLDCEIIEVEIQKDKTEEGLVLTPVINGDYDCLATCRGIISNQGAEVVSKLDDQSTGWSYFNDASTIKNKESNITLPKNFDTHSFRLNCLASQAAPYLETDVINLCPDEVYSVCFDHIESSNSISSSNKGSGLCVLVDDKCKYVNSSSKARQTCMSFKASNTNHKLQLAVDKRYFSTEESTEYYLDNVLVDHIPTEPEMELPVEWKNSNNQIFKTEVPEVDVAEQYSFRITGVIDTTSAYKKHKLYSLCFKAKLKTSNTEFNRLSLRINTNIEKQISLDNKLTDYCIEFLSDQREHDLVFSQVNVDGLASIQNVFTMENMVVRSNLIPELSGSEPTGILWTLPDGSHTSNLEVLVDQNGKYDLEFTNCHQCYKHQEFTSNIDFTVCPQDIRIRCGENFDPSHNSIFQLHQPEPPFSIGYNTYVDYLNIEPCLGEFTRQWTIERLYKGEVFDTTTCYQAIAVVDADEPQLEDFEDVILNCEENFPEPKEFAVVDNCTRRVGLSSEDIEYSGTGCAEDPLVIIRYWTAIDACGNSITKPEKFMVVYDLPEVACPPSYSVLCEEDIVAGVPEVSWNCHELESSYIHELTLDEGVADCNGAVYNMLYTIQDACGRIITCVQNIGIEGQTLELICPSSVTVSCVEDFEYGAPSYTVSCGSEISLSHSDLVKLSGDDNCDGAEYQVEYSVEDYCGLNASCLQSIFISNSGITITCPDDQEVSCPEDITAGISLVEQACNLQSYSGHTMPYLVSGIAECSEAVYAIEYQAADDCENQVTCIQKFTIENSGMTISCPPDLTVECLANFEAGIPELFSYCYSEPEFSFSDPMPLTTGLSCDLEEYEVEYTGTNACGDEVSCMQVFTLSNSGLSLACPSDQVVSCVEDIIAGEPFIQSACNVYYSLNTSEPILDIGIEGCAEAVYNMLYELEDDCGNSTSCLQSFVLDNAGLSIECPSDKVVTHFDEIQPDELDVYQPCGIAYELTISEASLYTIDCEHAIYIFTYTVENACTESMACDQEVILTDDENAIDSEFICANPELFIGLDCDQGGIDDIDECNNGTDLDYPCDDVTIELEPFDALCFGDSSGEVSIVTINGNPPYDFSLDSLNWTLTPNFENLYAGDYTVYIRSTNGPECFFSEAVTISEPPLSEAEAGEDQEICIGYEATLSAAGGATYEWSTGEPTQTIEVTPSETTTYIVTVTQSDGCSNSDEMTVIVNENNAGSAGANQEICLGYFANLVASGGVSYLWSTGDLVSDISVSPLITTTYSVTATDANGCTDTSEVLVIVNNSPDGHAGDDEEICLGEGTTLTASGGISYEWSTGSIEASVIVAPLESSTYSVTVTDENGCTNIDEVEVIVNYNDGADAGSDHAICLSESTNLTATGGVTYLWSTGETTSTINVNPDVSTNYLVTVTDDEGCTDTDEVQVTVNPLPVAAVSGEDYICLSYSVTLSATGGSSYLWSTGETTQNISVSPSATTMYHVTVTDDYGCTDTTEKEVVVNSNDSADAGTDEELCIGEVVVLQATGGESYLWSTGEITATIIVAPAATTTYSVTTTDSNGCTDVALVEVVVHPLPSADVGADQAICFSESTNLTATGGVTYVWSTGETTSTINVNPDVTTSYTVTVTDDKGCTDTDDVQVTVNPLPVAAVSGEGSICLNYSVTLSATGGTSYLWSSGATTQDIIVSPSATTMYHVTVTDDNGCTDTAEKEVVVNSNDSAAAGSDEELCIGEEVGLEATGGESYLWSTGEITDTITVAPSSTMTYSVTTTDSNGCTDVAQVEVVVHPLPSADAGADQAICLGESTNLTATGGVTYLWSTGETTSTINVNPDVSTNYLVTVTDDEGCTDTDEVQVTVNPLPVAAVSGEDSICLNYSATLSATGGTSYLWSSGATTQDISVSPSTTTMYHVTVTDDNGCTDAAEKEVVVNSNDSADAGSNEELCIGEEVELQATGGENYLWNTGETSAAIIVAPAATATYTVTTTDSNGCTDLAEVTVTIHPLPNADAGSDQAICLGEYVSLEASGGAEYLWSTGDTVNIITVSPDSTISYAVTVTNDYGCTDVDNVEVIVSPLPEAETSSDIDLCIGDIAELTATGGVSYLWSTGESTDMISVSPSETTSYVVTVTDELGCSDVDSALVIIHLLPLADAGPDQNICVGADVILNATGGENYLWSTGDDSASITVAPSSNTTYFVTVTDANGCTNEDEVQVAVHEYPNADAGGWAVACGNDGTTLTATGSTNYLWSTGDTTAVIAVYPTSYQVFTVTVSNDYGCSDVAEVHVFAVPSPPADAGPDLVICPGEYAVLYGYGGDEYLWEPNLFLDTNTGPFVVSTPDSTITYTMTTTDESGCTATDQVTVTVEEDTTPPDAQCWDIVVYTDVNGQATISPYDVDSESSDNCTPVDLELDETMFSCLLQDYTVTLTVTDYYGNSSTCEAVVTLAGPDNDCDLMANGCDLCEGGDDTVDEDGDGFPDCAYPPDSFADVKDLWKCDSGNNVEEVWVCHSPNQSICIDYAEVYTHVSYHQDDYLGPCHAIGCFLDKVEVEGVLDDLEAINNKLIVTCPPSITHVNSHSVTLMEELKSAVTIKQNDCEIHSITIDLNEEYLQGELQLGLDMEVEFTIKDVCGNREYCTSLVEPKQENLKLFPNPTNDWLNVSGLQSESYVIYNARGERVTIVNYAEILNVSYLKEGIYLLVTNTGRSSRFVISGIH